MAPAKKPKKKQPKHPKDMTTEEVAKSLFHPEVLQEIREQIDQPKPHKKKSTP